MAEAEKGLGENWRNKMSRHRAVAKIKEADAVAEIGSKWLGRIVKFAPWAYEIIKNIHV